MRAAPSCFALSLVVALTLATAGADDGARAAAQIFGRALVAGNAEALRAILPAQGKVHLTLTRLGPEEGNFGARQVEAVFRDFLAKLGNTATLIPGIIPILSATQIKKFTALCGARIPAALAASLEKLGDREEAAIEFGIEYATRQCRGLLEAGATGLHFYTLNKAGSTVQVAKNLGLAGHQT